MSPDMTTTNSLKTLLLEHNQIIKIQLPWKYKFSSLGVVPQELWRLVFCKFLAFLSC
jgi:hypothetical protein